MQIILVIVAVLLSILSPANGNSEQSLQPKKYALLVAVDSYEDSSVSKLRYAEADAQSIKEVLIASGYEVDLLTGRAAIRDAILNRLSLLNTRGNKDGAVMLGFFGHGVEFDNTKEAMFCPYDFRRRVATDANKRELYSADGKSKLYEPDPDSLVGMSEILTGLTLAKAGNKFLLADCCRSNPNSARGSRAFGTSLKISDIPNNTAAIFACSEGEEAQEHEDWKHGALTKCFLELVANMHPGSKDVNAIVGRLQENVSKIVSEVTNGQHTQTIHPIMNGVVDLKLKIAVADPVTNKDVMAPKIPEIKRPDLKPLIVRGEYQTDFTAQVGEPLPSNWDGPSRHFTIRAADTGARLEKIGQGMAYAALPSQAVRELCSDDFELDVKMFFVDGQCEIVLQSGATTRRVPIDTDRGWRIAGQRPPRQGQVIDSAKDSKMRIKRKGPMLSVLMQDLQGTGEMILITQSSFSAPLTGVLIGLMNKPSGRPSYVSAVSVRGLGETNKAVSTKPVGKFFEERFWHVEQGELPPGWKLGTSGVATVETGQGMPYLTSFESGRATIAVPMDWNALLGSDYVLELDVRIPIGGSYGPSKSRMDVLLGGSPIGFGVGSGKFTIGGASNPPKTNFTNFFGAANYATVHIERRGGVTKIAALPFSPDEPTVFSNSGSVSISGRTLQIQFSGAAANAKCQLFGIRLEQL